jgi:hypothetical protein
MQASKITIDVSSFYAKTGTAKLSALSDYETAALDQAGEGNVVKLTGPGPVWLYLRLAHVLHGKARQLIYTPSPRKADTAPLHVLHGKARQLIYDSPATGEVTIFNHDPW